MQTINEEQQYPTYAERRYHYFLGELESRRNTVKYMMAHLMNPEVIKIAGERAQYIEDVIQMLDKLPAEDVVIELS